MQKMGCRNTENTCFALLLIHSPPLEGEEANVVYDWFKGTSWRNLEAENKRVCDVRMLVSFTAGNIYPTPNAPILKVFCFPNFFFAPCSNSSGH
jgi:hypothetical protein